MALTIVLLLVVVVAIFVDGRTDFGKVSNQAASDEKFGLAEAHRVFCDLFDAIYGTNMWSAQRLVMSSVSTLLGLAVIVIAIGPYETVFGVVGQSMGDDASSKSESVTLAIATGLVAFLLNFLPDFFSLSETRFILRLAGRLHGNRIFVLMLLDLVLTSAIFMLMPVLFLFFVGGISGQELLTVTLARSGLLPFFLTTFLTSLLWILYVCSVVAIRMLNLHRATKGFVQAMARSDYPTVAFSAVANLVVAVLWSPAMMLFGLVAGPGLPINVDGASVPHIEIGRRYRASFVEKTDYDVSFTAKAGTTYVVEAAPILGGDTTLAVRESGSEKSYASDDDGGVGLGSRIVLVSSRDGEYVVHIASFGGQKTPASDFRFSVREGQSRESECQ